jgi:hypothetical protein
MPRLNLTAIPDSNFELVPTGEYLLQIKEIDNSKFDNATGGEKWKIKMSILNEVGKNSCQFDNWNFFGKGLGRVKYNLKALGFNVDQELDVAPEDLVGKVIYATIEIQKDNRDPLGQKVQNKLPWNAIKPLDKYPDQEELKKILENLNQSGGSVSNDPDIGIEDVPF